MEQPPLNRDTLLSVLSQTDKTVQLGSQLSKSIYRDTSSAYVEKLCDAPISLTEVKKFIATFPDSFIVYQSASIPVTFRYLIDPATGWLNLTVRALENGTKIQLTRSILRANNYLRKVTTITDNKFYDDGGGFVSINQSEKLDQIYRHRVQNNTNVHITRVLMSLAGGPDIEREPDLEGVIELDFLSQYRIYQNRLGCVARIDRYSQNKILHQIDILEQSMSRDIAGLIFAHYRLYHELEAINHGLGTRDFEIESRIFLQS